MTEDERILREVVMVKYKDQKIGPLGEHPKLRTARCVLDRVTQQDVPQLSSIVYDETTLRFMPELLHMVKTEEDIRWLLNACEEYLKKDACYIWGIRYNGCLAGFIGIKSIHSYPLILYAMDSRYRRMEIMSECAAEVVRWFRETHPSYALYAEAYKENFASIQILKKIGLSMYDEDDDKLYLKMPEVQTSDQEL